MGLLESRGLPKGGETFDHLEFQNMYREPKSEDEDKVLNIRTLFEKRTVFQEIVRINMAYLIT